MKDVVYNNLILKTNIFQFQKSIEKYNIKFKFLYNTGIGSQSEYKLTNKASCPTLSLPGCRSSRYMQTRASLLNEIDYVSCIVA